MYQISNSISQHVRTFLGKMILICIVFIVDMLYIPHKLRNGNNLKGLELRIPRLQLVVVRTKRKLIIVHQEKSKMGE